LKWFVTQLSAQPSKKAGLYEKEQLVFVPLRRLAPRRFWKWQTIFEMSLLLIGLGAQLFKPHVGFYGDGLSRFRALSELLQDGTLSPNRHPLIGPLFSAPLWFAGKVVLSPAAWCSRYSLFVFVAGLLAMYWLLRKKINHSFLRKFFLILLVGSMFPTQLTSFYGELFTAICVGVGLLAAVVRPSLPAWGVVVLGVANAPASIVGMACVAATRMLEQQKWRYVLAVIAALALIMLENWLRRGSPLTTGYEGDRGYNTVLPYSGLPGFSYPFFFGLLSILFSFGKGLAFFASGLLLPIRKRLLSAALEVLEHLYGVYVLWLAFLIGLILVYSRWWAWSGDWAWGPRFFLFASLPASLALAVRLHRLDDALLPNLATAAALVLSFWVGIDGVVFNTQTLDICLQNQDALQFLCHYVPEFSVLWRPFVVPEQIGVEQWLYIAYSVVTLAYLGLPLFRLIVGQALAEIRIQSQPYLKPGVWHF
jgi:uncharacterized membrane protein